MTTDAAPLLERAAQLRLLEDLRKLGVRSRSEAGAEAARLGIVER